MILCMRVCVCVFDTILHGLLRLRKAGKTAFVIWRDELTSGYSELSTGFFADAPGATFFPKNETLGNGVRTDMMVFFH